MSCKWCKNKLTNSQVREFLRGKTKGTACSKSCAQMMKANTGKTAKYVICKGKKRRLYKSTCKSCNVEFESVVKNQGLCSSKCVGKLSSKRMKENNPMKNPRTRKKVSDTLKNSGYKPIIQGGNGKGMTKHERILFEKLIKIDESFVGNFVQKTKHVECDIKRPNHYKIDIASKNHMIAVEVDGPSHKSLKVQECDRRKQKFLNLIGWKVLRFSNYQIENELENCVQRVMSMI